MQKYLPAVSRLCAGREYQSDHPNPHIQNYLRGGRGVFSEEGNGIEFAAERSQTTVSAPLENPVYYEEQESTSSSQPPTTASSTEVYEEEEEEEATSETTTEQPEEEEQTTPPPQKKEESEGPLSVSYYTYEYGEDYNETSQEQKQEITTSDENRLWRLLLLGASNEQVGMRSLRQRINDITASLLEIQNRLDSVLEANGGSPARTTAQSRSETDEPTDPFVLPTTGNQGFQAGLDRISTPLRKAIDRRGSPPSNWQLPLYERSWLQKSLSCGMPRADGLLWFEDLTSVGSESSFGKFWSKVKRPMTPTVLQTGEILLL